MSVAEEFADESALEEQMLSLGRRARTAAGVLANATPTAKSDALMAAAAAIRASTATILTANEKDMEFGRGRDLSKALLDRLWLNDERIEAMAQGVENVAALEDPVGSVIAEWTRPNGLKISRVRTPLGVVGMIYESRPNVTADAGGLCLKSGNAVILRGGSESFHSSGAIHACLVEGLTCAHLPEAAIQLVPTRDRAAVGMMLTMADLIDIIVPRGGKGLTGRVMRESRVPVIAHLEGICHIYVDGSADPVKARAITVNAKMRRTGICGAAECLLVDSAAAEQLLAPLVSDLLEAGCEVRGDEAAQAVDARVRPAVADDWGKEFLDAIIAVKVIDGVDGAIEHIAHHGSRHTDSIVTEDAAAAKRFLARVDSAIVLHNASTQFADGGEFGMGAEIGISTNRLHARGPVGVEQLTTFKYVVQGDGQIRP